MSDRAVIAKITQKEPDGNFHWKGVYHRFGGIPNVLGAWLLIQYYKNFQGRLGEMTKILIDNYPQGWIFTVGRDLSLPPIETKDCLDADDDMWKSLRPFCYPNNYDSDPIIFDTDRDTEDAISLDFAYIFDIETLKMYIQRKKWEKIGKKLGFEWITDAIFDLKIPMEIDPDYIPIAEDLHMLTLLCGGNYPIQDIISSYSR